MTRAAKKGLGRGLDALIPDQGQPDEKGTVMIPASDIVPSPYQPRKAFEEEGIQELAQSIREHGVVQPLIVRPEGDGYELVAGERRLRAARIAGLEMVPVIVRDVSPQDALQIALIENLQREELNPIEEAEAYQRLSEEFGMTQEEIALKVGKSRTQVTNTMRLLQLSPEVKQLVACGKISMGHAKVLLGVNDLDVQRGVAEEVATHGLSVRETEELVGRGLRAPRKKNPPSVGKAGGTWSRELEDRLKTGLGTMVKIKGQPQRGCIEIRFYGEEDLERLLEMLLGGYDRHEG